MADLSSTIEEVTSWVCDEGRSITATYVAHSSSIPIASAFKVLEAVQNGPHAHQITPLYLVIGTVENSHRGSGKVSRDASGGTGASALSTWGSAVEQGSVVARVQAVVPEDKMDGASKKFTSIISQSLFGLAPKTSFSQVAEESNRILPTIVSDAIGATTVKQMRELSLGSTDQADHYRRNQSSVITMPGLVIGEGRRRLPLADMPMASVPSESPGSGTKAAPRSLSGGGSKDAALTNFFGAKEATASSTTAASAPVASTKSGPSRSVEASASVSSMSGTKRAASTFFAAQEPLKPAAKTHDADGDVVMKTDAAVAVPASSTVKDDFAKSEESESGGGDDGDEPDENEDDAASHGSQRKSGGGDASAEPEEGQPKPARRKRKADGPPRQRKPKGMGGTTYSEGVVVEGAGGDLVVQEDGAAKQSKEADLMDAFRSTAVAVASRARKKLVTKTYMDARGYLVTEDVWEDDPDAPDVPLPPPQAPTPAKSAASAPTRQPSKVAGTTGKAGAFGAGPGKQLGLASFFGKK